VANESAHPLIRRLRPVYLGLQFKLYRDSYTAKVQIQNILASKPKLLVLISVITFAIFTPLVITPHTNRPFLIYFIILHISSIIISIFLITVSILAYRRSKSKKVLYTTIGFLSLFAVELLFLLQVVPGTSRIMNRAVYASIPHILLLLMLTLFGIGVLKVDK
jgi:hypothetical protein